MKYTDENINKLEHVFKIMATLGDVKDPVLKKQKIKQVCQLLYEADMVDSLENPDRVLKIYNHHLLNRIREIVDKSQ